ncbi:MFS transporter [Butyrivibrio sp. NC3005]|uniref:MFS transporter n=1 Tax=Butyrivibrio sp. NC3005 TaxID=1280685 RepID=UPI000424E1DE|nr:MFS transporter [Butyrivibrio sp. NC3005]
MDKVKYRDILKLKEYRKLIASSIVNRFGDSVDAIAFTWLVYMVTGSASWSAIIYALNQLPTVLLQPFAGALVERMNKKKIMVAADLIRGFIIVAVACLYKANGSVSPWVLAAMTLMISSVEAFGMPAGSAFVPLILEKKYYSYGLSLNSTVSNIMQLVGMASAGIIIGVGGIEAAMFVDAATFFISGLFKISIKVKETIEDVSKKNGSGVQTYFKTLKEGFKYVAAKKVILNCCILAMLANATLVPLNALQSPMAVEIFGQGSEFLSVMGIALIIGTALGSLITPKLMGKFKERPLIVFFGIALGIIYGLYTLGIYTHGNVIAAYSLNIVCALIMGIAISVISQIFTIQFMNSVENEYLARAASILNATSSAATPLTSGLVSLMAKFIPVTTLFIISSSICIVIFAFMGIAKVKFSEDEEKIEKMPEAV